MNKSFYRKVAYALACAFLLLPLAWLSQPDTGKQQTGKLAALRKQYHLSQAELGDIDPGSESMKLAMFGLHGVAANLLWAQADKYKMKKNWEKLEATLKQIARLQPNFKTVWDFQAHNLSYNVSVEFDNYEHRYIWVKKGIGYLIEGTRYNRDEPIMYWNLGWYTGQKLGRSDERVQFRRLYRDDTAFHDQFREQGINVDDAPGADGKPDNWFTARLWFLKGQTAADDIGRPIRGKSPLIFHNQPAMSLINGADAMEKETYDAEVEKYKWDRAQENWRSAGKEYAKYGERMIPTSWGHPVQLGQYDSIQERIAQEEKQLDALAPGAKDELQQAKIGKLSPEQKEIFDKKESDRSPQEQMAMHEIEEKLAVSPYDIADKAEPKNRPRARLLADQIMEDRLVAQHTNSYRGIINYAYWAQRCAAEQTDKAIDARRHLLAAEEAKKKTDLTLSKQEFETSFKLWRELFDKYPLIMDNAETRDLIDSVGRYVDVLGQLDEDFTSDFILNDLLKTDGEVGPRLLAQQRKVEKAKPEATKPEEKKPEETKPDEPKPVDGSSGKADDSKKPADENTKKEPAEPAAAK